MPHLSRESVNSVLVFHRPNQMVRRTPKKVTTGTTIAGLESAGSGAGDEGGVGITLVAVVPVGVEACTAWEIIACGFACASLAGVAIVFLHKVQPYKCTPGNSLFSLAMHV
jgi:hypothetical protein